MDLWGVSWLEGGMGKLRHIFSLWRSPCQSPGQDSFTPHQNCISVILCISFLWLALQIPKTEGLHETEIYFLTVVKVRNMKERCHQGRSSSEVSREAFFLASARVSLVMPRRRMGDCSQKPTFLGLWPHHSSFWLDSHLFFFPLSLCKDHSHWIQGPA